MTIRPNESSADVVPGGLVPDLVPDLTPCPVRFGHPPGVRHGV